MRSEKRRYLEIGGDLFGPVIRQRRAVEILNVVARPRVIMDEVVFRHHLKLGLFRKLDGEGNSNAAFDVISAYDGGNV